MLKERQKWMICIRRNNFVIEAWKASTLLLLILQVPCTIPVSLIATCQRMYVYILIYMYLFLMEFLGFICTRSIIFIIIKVMKWNYWKGGLL